MSVALRVMSDMAGSTGVWRFCAVCALGWTCARLEIDRGFTEFVAQVRAMRSEQRYSAYAAVLLCLLAYVLIVAPLWRTAAAAAAAPVRGAHLSTSSGGRRPVHVRSTSTPIATTTTGAPYAGESR